MNCLNKHLHCFLDQIKLSKDHTIPAFPRTHTQSSWLGSQVLAKKAGCLIEFYGSHRYKVKPSNSPAMCFLLSSTLSSRKASFRTWPFSRGPRIRHLMFCDKYILLAGHFLFHETFLTQAVHSFIILLFLTWLKRGKFKTSLKYSPSLRIKMKACFSWNTIKV